ncbi:hypothetical protein QT381_13610 [Galbitalea sp. SE-J8]|uniref:hypothetical protein n=1 Tax=Galbitalea sp. SE-J8 TaxID=3054952 RepID=UPI00259CF162|nr:hypothetical protein [Galbitalea sp. SE-J8]MDM4764047.1 hypothetical protein [Galbitalea sp. SE-J8]
MSSRPLIRLSGVVATALLAAVALVPAGTATAAPANRWTRVSLGAINNFTSPDLLRLPTGALLAAWQENGSGASPTDDSIQAAIVSPDGRKVGSRSTIASGWATLSSSPHLAIADGSVLAAYVGIHSLVTEDPLSGPVLGSRSADGVTWAQDALPLSGPRAGGVYGLDLVTDGHQPYTAFIPTSTDTIGYHAGQATSFDDAGDVGIVSAPAGDAYDVALVRDSATGDIYSTWKALGGPAKGLNAQRIWPTPGPATPLPGALTGGDFTGGAVAVPIGATSTSRGGVWLAYGVGYPTATTVLLYNPASGKRLTVASKQPGVTGVTASAGPDGRVWVAWLTRNAAGSSIVRAARSNSAVTRFGAAASVPVPASHGYGSASNVAAEGSSGALDVVVNASVPGDPSRTALYQTRIPPLLSVALSKTAVSRSAAKSIRVTVTDAGAPVARAKVTWRGKKFTTSKKGTVTIRVPKGLPAGKKSIAAAKSGYTPGAAKLTITKR